MLHARISHGEKEENFSLFFGKWKDGQRIHFYDYYYLSLFFTFSVLSHSVEEEENDQKKPFFCFKFLRVCVTTELSVQHLLLHIPKLSL